jgi:hypothetical protein
MTLATPPRWAEWVLRMFLARQNREAVSGDLLEEYREVIVPERGRGPANIWYAGQVFGYVIRHSGVWAVLFSSAFLARQVYDALVPTIDFHVRAEVTTYTAIGLLLGGGFWASWRSGSMLTGVLSGVATTAIAAVISAVGGGVILAIWHDPERLANIRNSGGIEEMFVLPFFAIVLGMILGAVGGLFGASARQIQRITFT